MISFYTAFDLIRFIPPIIILLYVAIQDHKTGQVSNHTWLCGFLLCPLTIIYLSAYPEYILLTTLSVAFSCIFALGLFYVGLWGGADAKAIIFIALAAPLTPTLKLPLPLLVLCFASFIALTYRFARGGGKLGFKTHIRYLPYIFVGYLITLLL